MTGDLLEALHILSRVEGAASVSDIGSQNERSRRQQAESGPVLNGPVTAAERTCDVTNGQQRARLAIDRCDYRVRRFLILATTQRAWSLVDGVA